MLEKIVNKLSQAAEKMRPLDPSTLNDEIAMKTSWEPLKGGGTSTRGRKLVKAGADRAVFKATIIRKLVCAILPAFGIYWIWLMVRDADTGGFTSDNLNTGYLVVVGILIASGIVMFHFSVKPIVFDKRVGCFWKGWKSPHPRPGSTSLKRSVPLGRIHALQLVSELCGNTPGRSNSSSSRFMSYELNLVLDDASRVNVVDQGGRRKLIADATVLSEFLGKPVWDATGKV